MSCCNRYCKVVQSIEMNGNERNDAERTARFVSHFLLSLLLSFMHEATITIQLVRLSITFVLRNVIKFCSELENEPIATVSIEIGSANAFIFNENVHKQNKVVH